MIAIAAKSIYLISCFLLLFSLLTFTGTALCSVIDKDEDENEPPAIDLHEILQVQALDLPVLAGEWSIDGVLDESFWEQAARYEIKLETYPALLEPSPVKTEVLIARIDDNLMIGFVAHDPEPEKIQAPLRDRDSIEFDDYVGFSVDLSGKLMTRYEFYVTASGIQGDWVHDKVDDLRSRDWDANWESGATIGDHGYTVEMRIPLAQLTIPVGKDQRRLLLFKRHYPRAIRHHLNAITDREVASSKDTLKKRLLVIPSLTLLNEQSRNAEEDEDWEADYKSEFGLDIGYKITPSLDLLATYNPNFLEIEADLIDWSINDPFTPLVVESGQLYSRRQEIEPDRTR
jgi:hypothetical protein